MRVLIVGAGIGGEALAVLLARQGWRVEVAEIAPSPRSGGQTVDLRKDSAQVLAKLGVLEQCRRRLVPQSGIAWVDAAGRARARMGVEAFGGRGFVSDEELLRSDLAEQIHLAVDAGVRYRYSESVRRFTQNEGAVEVEFDSGDSAVFDLVVGSDGTHSRVRSLLFGPEAEFRRALGLAIAWFTMPEQHDTPPLDGWFQVHNAPGSLVVGVRPGRPTTQEVGFTFPAGELPDRRDVEARFTLLEERFAGVGWRTPELLRAARAATDFSMDTCDQIQLPRWHEERIVLLGDSAWCASPLSGLGTALALQGASALAAALDDGDPATSLDARLQAYEASMRPRVTAAQRLPPGRVRLHAPRTMPGIRIAALLMRAIQTPALSSALQRIVPT